MSEFIFTILLAVIVLSLTTIYLTDTARIALIFLGALYLCVFFLLMQVWPVGLATVVLLTGMLTVIIINSFCSNLVFSIDTPRAALDILIIVFVGVITFAFAPQLSAYLPESSQFLIIGFFMFAVGLLKAGISSNAFQVMLSLFIFSLGFQVIYAPLEGSALVTALFSIIQIVLAFVASRLVVQHNEEVQ